MLRTLFLLPLMLLLGGCPGPTTYSCGGATGGHCYGVVRVRPAVPKGVSTSLTAVAMNGGDGHVSDEMWLVQDNNPTCGGGQCWVEVGLRAGIGCGGTVAGAEVFWADNRPNNGFFCHDLGALQPQEIGQPTFLVIAIRPLSPNTFDIEALTCTSAAGPGACPRRIFLSNSGNNSMAANAWNIGLEVSGSSGASAPNTSFDHNLVTDPQSPIGWAFLTTDGEALVSAPVGAGWTTRPSTSSSGGSWFTSCCN
jgi:hypothetical protein